MKHVLVIRLSALGDVAILAPVLKARAEANPEVIFTVAAPPMLEPLFEGLPNVHFLGLKKKQSSWKIFEALKGVGADTVADLHVVNRVGRALTLLRIDALLHFNFRFKVFRLRKGRISRMVMLRHWNMAPRRPQWQRYDDVFGRLFGDGSCKTPPIIHHPLPSKRIGIAPFSQHEGKVWPWANIEQLVKMLAAKGYNVLLFGSKEEAPQLEALAASVTGAESVAGRLTFREELDTIKGLSLMVSMDSANMHFASAVGTPVVSIWGATHPDFGFYGYGQERENALCANLPCQPCSAYGQKACRYGDYHCLKAITPEMVINRISTLIAN